MRHYGGGIGHFNNAPFSEDHDSGMDMLVDDENEESFGDHDLEAVQVDGLESDSELEEGSLSSSSSMLAIDSDVDSDSEADSEFEELVSF